MTYIRRTATLLFWAKTFMTHRVYLILLLFVSLALLVFKPWKFLCTNCKSTVAELWLYVKCAERKNPRGAFTFLGVSVFVFVYEATAAGTAFFGATNADSVLFANVSVFVVAAIAYVTVDFLVKFVVHNFLLVALFSQCCKSYYAP